MLRSRSGHDDEVFAALSGRHPHLAMYRRDTLPERFHLREQPRVTPVVAVADEGWTITSRARTARGWPAGNHGYDNQLESMRGIFVAHGPSFRRGLRVGTLEAVDVYPLMADILDVPPAAHDGSLAAMAAARSSRAHTGTPR